MPFEELSDDALARQIEDFRLLRQKAEQEVIMALQHRVNIDHKLALLLDEQKRRLRKFRAQFKA